MLWRDWIIEGYQDRAQDMRPDFRDGAPPDQIKSLEAQLGCPLPAALRELLEQTDGVRESMHHGGIWFEIYTPVWSCEEIATHHRSMLAGEERCPPRMEPSKTPVYFADAGTDGVVFGFMVEPGAAPDPAVYGYYPIESKWRCISPSLAAHMHGWKI